ncbi:MAG TPA: leucyl/phenylalanyl-tRNA--protein transferase [Crenotrichaceae bacterium]|nr:leucyl/phenylalanyl-tRNA--protein transferase [Crenotrichaceae bacterium]
MIIQLNANNPGQDFPNVDNALQEPDGLLAIGGDLLPERLLNAYRHGIFPWFNDGSPIMWWSPDPRMIFVPEQFQPSRSLRKILRRGDFTITWDRAFQQVISACAEPRDEDGGTWITEQMMTAYIELHRIGVAHSIEAWKNNELVGGLYGVAIGQVFFGESMFSRVSNASKVALATLMQLAQDWQYQLVDCQVYNDHLASMGARLIPRKTFSQLLNLHCPASISSLAWQQTVTGYRKRTD